MGTSNGNRGARSINIVLGAALIIVGILFMLGQVFDFRLGSFIWPFYIIVPGVLLFAFALTMSGSAGEGLAIFASVVTITGALLLYQNTFDHFESWAYAWALVAPTSIGLGMIIYGSIKSRAQMVQNGKRLATIGGVIFLVGGVFFELIIGISDRGLGSYTWAILLIVLGVFFLVRSLLPRASVQATKAAPEADDQTKLEKQPPA